MDAAVRVSAGRIPLVALLKTVAPHQPAVPVVFLDQEARRDQLVHRECREFRV